MSPHTARRGSRALLIALGCWLGCAVWNSVKPPPAGTHVASLPARLGESEIEFLDDGAQPGLVLGRELDAVSHAEQMIVVDQSPLPDDIARRLLLRKRQRPNLEILLVGDPRTAAFGGTPLRTLDALERAGIVVARARLERMRDSDPLYSSLWRLAVGWWGDALDDARRPASFTASLRRRNRKADERSLLVADDGAGGWITFLSAGTAAAGRAAASNVALAVHGHLARAVVASEVRIAEWSTQDDRLPAVAPADIRGVGTIDARLLTEGAIERALDDLIGTARGGDTIDIVAGALDERSLVEALRLAAGRDVRVRLLLDGSAAGTRAAAGELMRGAGDRLTVRWLGDGGPVGRFALVRQSGDAWLVLGSAQFTRDSLADVNLEADVELHMPVRAAPARAAAGVFARGWADAAAYRAHADESRATYLRYRLAQATGLALF